MAFSELAEVSSPDKRVIIVGAGPTGTLMALYLAQMNWQVAVYERRNFDHQKDNSHKRRNYNIVLSSRGLQAIQKAGVTLPEQQFVVLKGNIRHTNKGVQKSSGFSETVSINRNILAQHLFEEGIKRFSQNIKYFFSYNLKQIDFEHKIVIFEHNNSQVSQKFDFLIGADGVFSTVREMMLKQSPEFQCYQNQDQMTFKICPLGPANKFSDAAKDWGEYFHTWPSNQPITILAPPNPDASLTGILILPQQGEFTFEKIKNENDVEVLFHSKFPDIFPRQAIPKDLVQDLLVQKVSYGGITTVCNHFNLGNSVVLLGDAAHSMWPSLGQGCNAALESCWLLAQTLTKHDGDLERVLPEYSSQRKPDTDAIGRMSEQGFGGNKRAGNTLFFTKIIAISLLHKLVPHIFAQPALLQINQPHIGYAQVETQWQRQQKQLLLIMVSLIVFVTFIFIGIIWLTSSSQ